MFLGAFSYVSQHLASCHGSFDVLERLEEAGLEPVTKTSLLHYACELRKLLTGPEYLYSPRDDYRSLWDEVNNG